MLRLLGLCQRECCTSARAARRALTPHAAETSAWMPNSTAAPQQQQLAARTAPAMAGMQQQRPPGTWRWVSGWVGGTVGVWNLLGLSSRKNSPFILNESPPQSWQHKPPQHLLGRWHCRRAGGVTRLCLPSAGRLCGTCLAHLTACLEKPSGVLVPAQSRSRTSLQLSVGSCLQA